MSGFGGPSRGGASQRSESFYRGCDCPRSSYWDLHTRCHVCSGPQHAESLMSDASNPRCEACRDMSLDKRFKWLSKYSRQNGAAPVISSRPQHGWGPRGSSGQRELATQRERVVPPASGACVASNHRESAQPGQVDSRRGTERPRRALPRQHSPPRDRRGHDDSSHRNRAHYDDSVSHTHREERGRKRVETPDRHSVAFPSAVGDFDRRDLPSSQRYYTEGRANPTVTRTNVARSETTC